MSADRDLLFGLFALQNGLIDQDQLLSAFRDWSREKTRPLAAHLVDRGHLDPDQCTALDAMVALHLRKHGGDPEKSLATLPVGHSTRDRLAAIKDPDLDATIAHIAPGSHSTEPGSDADRTATYAVGSSTAEGQRFRVLRPHAKGGLGAVFVALDGELNREVALKQILDHHADDLTSRHRFLLEAEITGGLEHPGIVPVYGLGTYGNGRPYYAMRFVRGDSLKEAIDRFHIDPTLDSNPGRRSLELRKLLKRFTDVCNAIDYAHSRGVLHRDIKPGNVIVGKHGETLVVDWGLAKAQGHPEAGQNTDERPLLPSSSSGSAETMPGSALGTPAYMSPEQARGDLDALGPQSDVYSLGATLYCLLTGHAPFQGDDLGNLLRSVQSNTFPAPRKLDPAIEKPLEAICLKAMAGKPGDRYPSARALADDIDRWLADEPVAAYPEPWTLTLTRWLTRHRTAVTGLAAAGLVAMVGLAAVALVQTQGRSALAAKNQELESANARVEQRYNLAVDAVKTFHTGVSEDFLLKEPQFKDLRNRLLNAASEFYGKLGALLDDATDTPSRQALAQSNFELATLTNQVGRAENALDAHRAVLAARESLAKDPAAGPTSRLDLARSLLAVADLLNATGQTDQALATYRRSVTLLADPATGNPVERALLADSLGGLASLHSSTGNLAEAETEYREALALHQTLADTNPAVPDFRDGLSKSYANLAKFHSNTGNFTEAVAELRRALVLAQSLSEADPIDQDYGGRVAGHHYNLGHLMDRMGRPADAEAELREALAVYKALSDASPAITSYRSSLGDIHDFFGILMATTGRDSTIEAEFREGLAIRQKLVDDNPNVPDLLDRLAISHINLSQLLSESGRSAEAETHSRKALAIWQSLAQEHPDVLIYRSALSTYLINLGDLVTTAGKPAEGLEYYQQAITLLEDLDASAPTVVDHRIELAASLLGLGRAHHVLGNSAQALPPLQRSIALLEPLQSLQLDRKYALPCAHARLAAIAVEPESPLPPKASQHHADRAMALLTQLAAEGFRDPIFNTNPDLDFLRPREDFKSLARDLTFPDDPFAR